MADLQDGVPLKTGRADPSASVPQTPALQASFGYCHQITRDRAKNFYYGLKLTPEPRRSAGYAIYAFMRACDDLVDDPVDDKGNPITLTPSQGLSRVEDFRAGMLRVLDSNDESTWPDGKFWLGFKFAVTTYGLDRPLLHQMLDGMAADLDKTRYDTFEELYDYCYKVASVVGLACIRLWGAPSEPHVLKMAEVRGIAFQLTNILRDIVEDAQRGRQYLPTEELKRFNVDYDALARGVADANFDRLMAFQIQRAYDYYDQSQGLENHLDPGCRSTSWALMKIYRGLLDKIAKDPRAVLTKRVRLSTFKKVTIGLQAHLKQLTASH
jgi:phytoene synthase